MLVSERGQIGCYLLGIKNRIKKIVRKCLRKIKKLFEDI